MSNTFSIFVLMLGMLSVASACSTVDELPSEDVHPFADIPMPEGFELTLSNPVPKTSSESHRFARYAYTLNAIYPAKDCDGFYKRELDANGWAQLAINSDGDDWSSRWQKGRDLLVLTLSRRFVIVDGTSITQSHLLVEVNTP